MKFITLSALALAILLPLSACGQSPTDSKSGGSDASDKAELTGISGAVQKAMDEAKQELAHENIDVNSIHIGGSQDIEVNDTHIGKNSLFSDNGKDALPKAEITPQGDFLIAGKKVNATPAQHELLLDYRQQIVGIAEAGMDIGTEGVDLGMNAAKEALWGAFSGKSDKEIEAAIKPQTDKIQAAALKLCKRLPGLLSSQQKLATAMPEFRPYATMEQKDVDDCGKEMTDGNGKKGFAVFSD